MIIWRCDFCGGGLLSRLDDDGLESGKIYIWCVECWRGKYIDEEWK